LLADYIPPIRQFYSSNPTSISNIAPGSTSSVIAMSDFEDEMDVDAPAVDNSITFGGDQKKGKRSAANLPVEAEDSLPW
jgi:hypothetical protein